MVTVLQSILISSPPISFRVAIDRKAREINNYKAFWCAEKIKNTILTYQLENKRKPKIALMGLAFKADIDDLRESPAKYIAEK